MELIELVFFPVIFLLGIITSYQDWKYGKIKNKWITLGLIYAILAYAILITFYFSNGKVNLGYIIELCTNFLFAIAIGFGLWYTNIWTAGDGKLFIVFASLIPLSVYKYGYFKFTPSLILLINIFLFAFIIIFLITLIKLKIKDIKKAVKEFLKEFFAIKSLFAQIVSIFALLWIIQLLLSLAHISSFILMYGLTILLSLAFQKKFQQNTIYILIFISALRFIFDDSIYSIGFIINFLILVFLTGIIKSFLNGSVSNISFEIFTEEISVDRLKPGMILGENITKKENITREELDKLKKQPDINLINYKGEYYVRGPKSGLGLNNFIDQEAEGLTKKQISLIKKMKIEKVKINQTMPFAPFIFIGVLLTLIAKGNILIFIRLLF